MTGPRDGFDRWQRRRKVEMKASAELVGAAYSTLFADRWMLLVMLAGTALSAVAGLLFVGPAMLWGGVTPSFGISTGGVAGVLVAGVGLGVMTFVVQLTTGAVVAAALQRAEGRAPTLRSSLAVVWSRRRQILAWALMSTVVGVVIRMLERLGIGGVVAALTLNVGWAAATVFSMPVVIIEGTMPVETVRRSARVLKEQFGATVFGSVRLAIPWVVASVVSAIVACAGGALLYLGDGPSIVLGVPVVAVGVLGLVFCTTVSAALSAYLQTYLYVYARGGEVPNVDPRWLPRLAR